MVNKVVFRDCASCGQKRIPHIVMENRRDSPIVCEGCGETSIRGKGRKRPGQHIRRVRTRFGRRKRLINRGIPGRRKLRKQRRKANLKNDGFEILVDIPNAEDLRVKPEPGKASDELFFNQMREVTRESRLKKFDEREKEQKRIKNLDLNKLIDEA